MMELASMPDLTPVLAEIMLAVGAMALLMFGVFAGERSTQTVNGVAVALLAGAVLVVALGAGTTTTFEGAFVNDAFARFMKIATLIASAIAIAMAVGYARNERFERFEYPVLIILATIGMLMMISANDLISLYLGLELQSLAAYVVAAIHRDSVRSTEAGLKYFVLGALASGMLLYGASLVYGFTGQTNFEGIAAALVDGRSVGLVIGLVFVLAGIAFKISAVPFHMWTPDVYEGAPTPVTAFFAAAPKLAAVALMVRVTIEAFGPVTQDWQQVVSFIAIASMLLGSFAAIGQTNIKRLMAYSSIGNVGYILVGLAAGTEAGVQGVVLYLVIYVVMTLGAFACILAMRRRDQMVEDIDSLAGLARTQPFTAFMFAAILFSLAGIPPLAGFFAKYWVFLAAIEAELYGLAVIGVLSSVVGAYYYLRIVKLMYFDEPLMSFERMPVELKTVSALSGAFLLVFVLFAAPLVEAAAIAARSLF
ncbi:NADH-quinone oxidoreductase subunit NuoN [Faunimonas sp. B44]|uniref:NADH-quinone oxidoreductase subunit NuoN n=1 Tax=Faunimonas sp. B44 TaxID=3461493 RepID=UPI0040439CBF